MTVDVALPARRRGRPPTLDRHSVVHAAAGIAPERFTMTALAERLGVTPAALYHYFPNGDAVAEALAADLVDGIVLPEADLPWDEWLRDYGEVLRSAISASPWNTHLVGRSAPILSGLRHASAALAVLVPQGFTPRDALSAVRLVQSVATMAAMNEVTWPGDDAVAAQLSTFVAADPDGVEHLVSAAGELGPRDDAREFDVHLRCVIHGIAGLRHDPTRSE